MSDGCVRDVRRVYARNAEVDSHWVEGGGGRKLVGNGAFLSHICPNTFREPTGRFNDELSCIHTNI